MSLKAVHLLFITLSVLLALGFAVWAFVGDTSGIAENMKALGAISGICGVGLLVYGVSFLRKLKTLAS